MPVFMPWAPVGGWMCAASPATKTRPSAYRSTSRWLMRNTEDQRMAEAVVGCGDEPVQDGLDVGERGGPAALQAVRHPVAPAASACRAVESSGGTSIDIR